VFELLLAIACVVGGYGFGLVATYLIRNPHDWWQPEKWRTDPFLVVFLVPTFTGRALLGLGVPGRAATLFEAGMAAAVSFALFAADALILAL
jgi:hypothetical protein